MIKAKHHFIFSFFNTWLAGGIFVTYYLCNILLTLCRLWRGKCPRLHKSCFAKPRKALGKRLLEIVWYIFWVFDECPVAVIEHCSQDIESERQRSAGKDLQVHSLFSPKTQAKIQRRKKTYCLHRMQNFFLCYKVLG